jgi:hypothetical protein
MRVHLHEYFLPFKGLWNEYTAKTFLEELIRIHFLNREIQTTDHGPHCVFFEEQEKNQWAFIR